MVQRGQDLGLALEARQALRVGRDSLGQDLDGDLALQVGVGGPVARAMSSRRIMEVTSDRRDH